MKKSLRKKFQIMMVLFFGLFIVESILIILAVMMPLNIQQMRLDIQFIIILFMFITFIYFIILFYYIPYKYDHSYKALHQIFGEVSEGNYQIDLDLKTHLQDEEVQNLIIAFDKMMNIIQRFDELKVEKVYEHHQRLQGLLSLIPHGCMIVTTIGEIVYLNEQVKAEFPVFEENLNIIETLLPEKYETSMKPVIVEGLSSGVNLHQREVVIIPEEPSYKISSTLIKNRKGQSTGAVFLIEKKQI